MSELLSKIYHTVDISKVLVEGTNHFAVVYGLNCRKHKDSVVGHRSTQWKMVEECFRDIHNIAMGYEWPKGYCRTEFSFPHVPGINEIKAVKRPAHAMSAEDPTSNVNVQVTATINFKLKWHTTGSQNQLRR